MHPDALLSIEDLSVEFYTIQGKVTAVKNLSFHLQKGEILGIVGESGSGKSVSMMAIMQLLDMKRAEVKGKALFQSDEKLIDLIGLKESDIRTNRGKEIGMIFQEPMSSLNPTQKCGAQVMEVLVNHGIDTKKAKEEVLSLFEQVLIPEPERVFSAYPFEISGGQKQRVMIAMAIACKPKLIIADEPTTALDVTVQKEILKLLKELCKERGISMIFISHDLAVISQVVDNVLVMYKGDMIEFGTVEKVLANPNHIYTQALLHCRPTNHQDLVKLPTVSDFLFIDENGQFHEINYELKNAVANAKKEIKNNQPLIEINQLNVGVSKKRFLLKDVYKQILSNISFGIYEGETLGIVGESGSGKTTLGRTLMMLMQERTGSIKYKGVEINPADNDQLNEWRRKTQMIFQDPYGSLNPRMTVGEAIMEPMLVHNIIGSKKDSQLRAEELLYKVGLDKKYFNRYPHEFSGGQRQRISIARALAMEPEIIICDESVSALDVYVQAQVLNLLNSLKQEFKLTLIFISHDLSVVNYMSDRVLVMQNGKIVEIGKVDEIYHHPKENYTRTLLEAVPELKIFRKN